MDRWSLLGTYLQWRLAESLSKSAAEFLFPDQPMDLWQNYLRPTTIQEALQALKSTQGPALIIGGGTDLILDLQQGNHPPVDTLVDVSAIPALTSLKIRDGMLFVGAAVPIGKVIASRLVREHAECLVEACSLIGGPQVRNVATLGGNVVHALPAADGSIALMCLDVQAEVVDMAGSRRVGLREMYISPGRSSLIGGSELLAGFFIPLRTAGQASAFRRVMRAQGTALPILNLSAWLERRDGCITQARISAGPSGPTPRRIVSAEEALCGKPLSDDSIERSLAALLKEVSFRSSPRRASADYRNHLVGVLLRETLECAWRRAGDLQVMEK